MSKLICQALVIAVILPVFQLNAPRQSERPRRVASAAIRITTELVLLDVLVLNKKTGHIINNLSQQDFILYEDHFKQEITHFSLNPLPLSALFLLDVSPSVSSDLKHIQHVSNQVLQELRPSDEIALMTFSWGTKLIQPFTKDRELLTHQLATIGSYVDMNTRLNNAIGDAAYYLKSSASRGNRRVIILVSDNKAEAAPELEEEDTKRELIESGAIICGLQIAPLESMSHKVIGKITMAGGSTKDYLNPFAALTGGLVIKVGNKAIEPSLSQVIVRCSTRYSLGYTPSNQEMDGKFRKIKLAVRPEIEKREGGVIVMARQGYYAQPRSTKSN